MSRLNLACASFPKMLSFSWTERPVTQTLKWPIGGQATVFLPTGYAPELP